MLERVRAMEKPLLIFILGVVFGILPMLRNLSTWLAAATALAAIVLLGLAYNDLAKFRSFREWSLHVVSSVCFYVAEVTVRNQGLRFGWGYGLLLIGYSLVLALRLVDTSGKQ